MSFTFTFVQGFKNRINLTFQSSPKPRKEPAGKKTKAQRKAERDPNKPKKPPTAYFLWLGVNRANIKDKNPGITVTEIAKKAGEMWRSLDSDEKQVTSLCLFGCG